MPKYAYRCSQCDARYDRVEGFDAPSRHDCPECGGLSKRQFSAPTIVFKGSGWYSTDNKRSLRTDGSSDSSSSEDKPAAAAGDNGHGHSHGPGGHTHGPGGHSHDAPAAAPASTTTTTSTSETTSTSSDA